MPVLKYKDPADGQWKPVPLGSVLDMIRRAGDRMTGALLVPDATDPEQVVNLRQAQLGWVPIGGVIPYGGSDAPPGWHLCNGTAHGSEALKAVTGSDTTPDLRDKFILGAGGAQPKTGGAATVALTVAQMPGHAHNVWTGEANANHTHNVTVNTVDINHSHAIGETETWNVPGYSDGTTRSNLQPAGQGVGAPAAGTGWMSANNTHNHSGTTDGMSANHAHQIGAEGGGAAHENMPPFYALTYIMRKA
jgi:microcystin-dependent protein